ncbi:MAG: hypothetical protein JNM34_12475, partial [Chthonomonadaceae bacterium]|nr:hypothetical protein [Chthonomonadaceae bacterium]
MAGGARLVTAQELWCYSLEDLGGVGTQAPQTQGLRINSSGVVVGGSPSIVPIVALDPGSCALLQGDNGTQGAAYDINASGRICGFIHPQTGVQRNPCYWASSSSAPVSSWWVGSATQGEATGISSNNYMCGTKVVSPYSWFWSGSTLDSIVELDQPNNSQGWTATSVNSAATVVGSAFYSPGYYLPIVWTSNVAHTVFTSHVLGSADGWNNAWHGSAQAIDDAGTLIAYFENGTSETGAVLKKSGQQCQNLNETNKKWGYPYSLAGFGSSKYWVVGGSGESTFGTLEYVWSDDWGINEVNGL